LDHRDHKAFKGRKAFRDHRDHKAFKGRKAFRDLKDQLVHRVPAV
jgi:hypothetical protein